MRQIDVIAMVGKTHDATQAQQAAVRGHATQQDQRAAEQAARADRASEQVNATGGEDSLELSTDGGGNGAWGGETGRPAEVADGEAEEQAPSTDIGHIDFLA